MSEAKPAIKICGIKSPDLAYSVAKLGADYVALFCIKHQNVMLT